jgi:hypothetical protein
MSNLKVWSSQALEKVLWIFRFMKYRACGFLILLSIGLGACKKIDVSPLGASEGSPQVLLENRSLSESDAIEGGRETDEVGEPEVLGGVAATGAGYQLGDSWDRKPSPAFHTNHQTVVRGTVSTERGLISSNFIFMEKLSESEGLFIATVHALPKCEEDGVVLYSKEKKLHGYCSGVYAIVPETDAVLVSIEFFESKDLSALIPVEFAESYAGGERVRFFGIEQDLYIPGYYPLVSDSHFDCLLLASTERRIVDPDTIHPVSAEALWSLPITCDIQHGDSGGMVVNRSNQLVGVLWTGAYPKLSRWSSQELLNLMNANDLAQMELIWSQLNYIVPAQRILKARQQLKLDQ